jgi:DNA-binding NtrC family response regulator
VTNARKNIVLVEDELLIRLSAVEALEKAGFAVIEAEHAQAALRVLTIRFAAIHLVFTDIHMPGEMNGLHLAHHVSRHWPHISLLIASGEARPGAGDLPPGGVFLSKPYDLEHVAFHANALTRERHV